MPSLFQSEQHIKLNMNFSEKEWNALKIANLPDIRNSVVDELKDLYKNKYINLPKRQILNKKIVLILNGVEEDFPINQVLDETQVSSLIAEKFNGKKNKNILQKLLSAFYLPDYVFNKKLTEHRQRQAVAEVALTKGFVYENERIIDANERVTEDIYQKLRSLEIEIAEKSAEEGGIGELLAELGKYLFTIMIIFLMVIYLSANRKKIYRDNKKLLLITILIFMQIVIGSLIKGTLGWPSYLIPTTISSMLLGILFDSGVGFVGTAIIGFLLGGINGFDFSFTIMTIFVGLVSIYSVTHIRTRNDIFKAILYIIGAYFVVIFTFGILRFEPFGEIFKIFTYYILPNAILSPFITYMLLGVFERIFDMTTDVTLLELSDLNHPLLKNLAVKAPGTFHHSIVVGNLAEAAAKAIGANSLLARVGSYYHDIGKIYKPEYFIENQKGGDNKHEGLAPNMSAIILAAHVKNGIELAEKNGLPKLITDFIPEHHGTNLMSYFYRKAVDEKGEQEVNESDYKYPGPIPKSRETAIVMLADTVEAASKTLKNPSAGRLRKLAEELVEKRFLEGELDDCELTMRDLKGIVNGFLSVLMGIYHERIEYPKSENNNKKPPFKINEKKENSRIEVRNENSGSL